MELNVHKKTKFHLNTIILNVDKYQPEHKCAQDDI